LAADSISIETACRLNEITKETFYNWYNRGESEPESPYGAFTRAVDKAQAIAERANHRAAILSNPTAILFRRFPSHYPSEKLQAEITGQPIAVNAGVQVVIESSVSDGKESARLSPFMDEREGSPWYGRAGLSTDASGYIFDEAGRLVGVLRDLPAERAPAMPVSVQPVVQTSAAPPADRSNPELHKQIEELKQQIAAAEQRVANNNGVPSRLNQLVR
jgi:hypothetical protein